MRFVYRSNKWKLKWYTLNWFESTVTSSTWVSGFRQLCSWIRTERHVNKYRSNDATISSTTNSNFCSTQSFSMRTSSGTDRVDRTVVETTRFAIYVHIVSVVFGAEVLEKARAYHGQETVKFQSIYTVRIDLELPARSHNDRAFNRLKIERLITQFSLGYYVSSAIFVDEENSFCVSDAWPLRNFYTID